MFCLKSRTIKTFKDNERKAGSSTGAEHIMLHYTRFCILFLAIIIVHGQRNMSFLSLKIYFCVTSRLQIE